MRWLQPLEHQKGKSKVTIVTLDLPSSPLRVAAKA
jgi:hypothetical protein